MDTKSSGTPSAARERARTTRPAGRRDGFLVGIGTRRGCLAPANAAVYGTRRRPGNPAGLVLVLVVRWPTPAWVAASGRLPRGPGAPHAPCGRTRRSGARRVGSTSEPEAS